MPGDDRAEQPARTVYQRHCAGHVALQHGNRRTCISLRAHSVETGYSRISERACSQVMRSAMLPRIVQFATRSVITREPVHAASPLTLLPAAEQQRSPEFLCYGKERCGTSYAGRSGPTPGKRARAHHPGECVEETNFCHAIARAMVQVIRAKACYLRLGVYCDFMPSSKRSACPVCFIDHATAEVLLAQCQWPWFVCCDPDSACLLRYCSTNQQKWRDLSQMV
jgi:hypothetical protein